jgi:DNA uptake protein ComE-like DNA-binding protein
MRLATYLIAALLGALLTVPGFAQSTTSPTHPPSAAAKQAANAPKGGLVDINSASAAELDKLPGIGSARAQAIVANRPYKGKDELARRKIIPQGVYDQIKDKIVARQGTAGTASGSSSPPANGSKTK